MKILVIGSNGQVGSQIFNSKKSIKSSDIYFYENG